MIKILFVCHGNICRSPMAEYVMKDLVKKAEKNHSDELKFRINYAYSFGKDSASINWKSSDVFTIDLTGKGK